MAALSVFDATQLHAGFGHFAGLVAAHAPLLDQLNRFPVPDADTGRNLTASLQAALAGLESSGGLASLCRALAEQAFLGARGSSGTIMAQLIGGFCDAVADAAEVDGATLVAGLIGAAEAGPEAVVEVAPGSMVTVAAEVAEAVRGLAEPDDVDGAPRAEPGVVEVLELARDVGRSALARTRHDNPVLARAGVVDAGALGFLLLLDALLHVADGRALPDPAESSRAVAGGAVAGGALAGGAVDTADGPGFELMFELEAADAGRRQVMEALARWGDSVAVTGRAGRWTCHVHTDDAEAVLRDLASLGRTSAARVESLRPVR